MPPSYRKPAGPVLGVDDEDDVRSLSGYIPEAPPPRPVLAKPFTPDVLVATVRNILAARDRTFPASRP